MRTSPPRFLTSVLLAVLCLGSVVHAAFPEAPLREQERAQSRIQDSTRRAGAQLDAVIDEFERNGLGGGDLEVLKAIRGVLGGLSDGQMEAIVKTLGEAGAAPDAADAGAKVFGAFSGQKTVIVQLRRVLLEYQTQVALFELARLAREFGDRQTNNLHEAIALAQSGGLDEERPSAVHKVSLQLQQTEQVSLRDEVAALVEKLTEIAGLTSGSPDPRPTRAAAFCAGVELVVLLENAAAEIKAKRLLGAVSLEKESRDSLWQLATILEPEKSALEKLVTALERLDEGIAEQEAISARAASPDTPAEALQELRKREGVLADRTDFLARETSPIAPQAAMAMGEATDPMQDARAALAEGDRKRALESGAEVLTKLAEARAALVEKISEESPVSEVPEDRVAHLGQLMEDVSALKAKQEELKAEAAPLAKAGDAAALQEKSIDQAELETGAIEAASTALEQSLPEASALLDQAAEAMTASGGALAAGENDPEAQTQAIEKLAEAERQIGDKLEDLAASAEQLASIEELMEKLAPVIEEQSAANAEGTDAAEQAALGERSEALAQQAEAAAPDAAESLDAAAAQQSQAAQQLAAKQSAAAAQSAAMQQLQAAQTALAQQAADFAEELGREAMELPDMAALEDVAAAIEKAQGHVATAQEQLGSTEAAGELAEAALPLGDAAGEIDPFAAEPERLPEGVGEALGNAGDALAEANAAAEAGEGDPARAEAGLAADSLARAAAAVALARAGLGGEIAEVPSESESQSEKPGEGDKPGQGKGENPGEGKEGAPPGDQGSGEGGNYADASGGDGPRTNTRGTSRTIGLPGRERGTLTQSGSEALPAEYGAMIEQYLKNLSDSAGGD